MFNLFAPRCPLTLGLKVWTERRFRDIGEVLGASHLHAVETVEPGSDLFASIDNPEELIGSIFENVCHWMNVSSSSIQLKLVSGLEMAELSGARDHGRVNAAKSLYATPAAEGEPALLLISAQVDLEMERLLAIIARGVAHDVLRTRIPELFEAEDRMQIIDLVPVFFGLGVAVSNSTVRELHSEAGTSSSFQISRTGHLSAQVFGYALALFSWVRGESLPDWSRRLRLDARETMKSGLKYLTKTSDCVFDADTFGHRTQLNSLASLRTALTGLSATQQMNALLNLDSLPEESRQLTAEILPLLQSRDRDLRAQAVQSLGASTGDNEEALAGILNLCDDPDPPVRFAVASALHPGSVDDEASLQALASLLPDRDPGVVRLAAARLLEFDTLPETLIRPAVDLLKSGNVRCDGVMIQSGLEMLSRLCEDVDALLEAELDKESLAMIADLADEVLGEPETQGPSGSPAPDSQGAE